MYAKIKTKSNFRNLNGQWLHVKEIAGKRVSCEVVINGNSRTIDFQLSEVTEMNTKVESNVHPIFDNIIKGL